MISRSIGLPQSGGDIGNWGEPLGLFSLAVEVGVLAVCLYRLRRGIAEQP